MKYFTEEHVWIDVDNGRAMIGITEYGARELGEPVSVELPAEGEDFIIGDLFATLNGWVMYAPISGTVYEINEILSDDPALLSRSPEEKGWLCVIKNFDPSELDDMMTADTYSKYLDTLQ